MAGRVWYQNPGMNGSFWVTPFYQGANWITSGSLITLLRNGTQSAPHGTINLKGNFAVPWVMGTATDPVVTVTDGHKSIQVHIPLGTVIETPNSATDNSIGGADATQPYLVWTISGATMNTTSVQSSGSVITGTYGMQIDDGSGEIMTDQTTNQPGTNNSFGLIQDYELDQANADSNYIIQHMLAVAFDPAQINNTLVWPLKALDTSFSNTGSIPQGVTMGIPSSVTLPTGKSRGWNLLATNLQQFGWFYYNVGGAGGVILSLYSNKSANNALITDMQNSISDVMQYACILNYQSGTAGAQYSTSTLKGKTPGAVVAYPAPLNLDLSPTNGVNVLPSTFGAWYDTGSGSTHYNVKPTNDETPAVTSAPAQPTGVSMSATTSTRSTINWTQVVTTS